MPHPQLLPLVGGEADLGFETYDNAISGAKHLKLKGLLQRHRACKRHCYTTPRRTPPTHARYPCHCKIRSYHSVLIEFPRPPATCRPLTHHQLLYRRFDLPFDESPPGLRASVRQSHKVSGPRTGRGRSALHRHFVST